MAIPLMCQTCKNGQSTNSPCPVTPTITNIDPSAQSIQAAIQAAGANISLQKGKKVGGSGNGLSAACLKCMQDLDSQGGGDNNPVAKGGYLLMSGSCVSACGNICKNVVDFPVTFNGTAQLTFSATATGNASVNCSCKDCKCQGCGDCSNTPPAVTKNNSLPKTANIKVTQTYTARRGQPPQRNPPPGGPPGVRPPGKKGGVPRGGGGQMNSGGVSYGPGKQNGGTMWTPPGPVPPGGRPTVIWIHGGGWQGGNRNDAGPMVQQMGDMGINVISIDYPVGGGAENMIDAIKDAIEHFRNNAAEYGIDPNRLGVGGHSAGGHLAVTVGTTGGQEYDNGQWVPGNPNNRPDFVIGHNPPTDLGPVIRDPRVDRFIGSGNADDLSPINHVSPDDPPILIIGGTNDTVVDPTVHIDPFGEEASNQGADVTIIKNNGQGHEKNPPGLGPVIGDWINDDLPDDFTEFGGPKGKGKNKKGKGKKGGKTTSCWFEATTNPVITGNVDGGFTNLFSGLAESAAAEAMGNASPKPCPPDDGCSPYITGGSAAGTCTVTVS